METSSISDYFFDPLFVTSTGSTIQVKKTIVKKRTTASIHQYLALSNIDIAAKAKDSNNFEYPDKELYNLGVRPGQIWNLNLDGEAYFVSCVGYHDKGLVILSLRAYEQNSMPSVSLFKYPKTIKTELLNIINAKEAVLQSVPLPKLLDNTGNAKPGRELDVTLTSLLVKPGYWHDPETSTTYYISICKEGHYRVSSWFLPSGEDCTEECITSRNSVNMMKLLDTLLEKVYYGKNIKRTRNILSFKNYKLENAVIPASMIESKYYTQKIIGAYQNNVLPIKFVPSIKIEQDDWRELTKKWLDNSKIRSGQIYKMNVTGSKLSKDYFIRLHRRSCGNLHTEISSNKIFSNIIDNKIIQTLLLDNTTIKILFNSQTAVKLSDNYPIIYCPICNSLEPIICIDSVHLKKSISTVTPIKVTNNTQYKQYPKVGNIILYKNKPALFYKIIKTKTNEDKAMILFKNGKVTTVPKSHIHINKINIETQNLFFDNNFLIKRKFLPERWYDIITVGSRLRINPFVLRDELKHLAGQIITVINTPVKTGSSYSIKILEADVMVDLASEVLPVYREDIFNGLELEYNNQYWKIEEIINGTVKLYNNNKIVNYPEAAIHVMITRNLMRIRKIFTVENLFNKDGEIIC
jgi:hypothetical protein